MRLICTIPNDSMIITVFYSNEKYVVKCEASGSFEQTYKIPKDFFKSVEELVTFINENLLNTVFVRFLDMKNDLKNLLN